MKRPEWIGGIGRPVVLAALLCGSAQAEVINFNQQFGLVGHGDYSINGSFVLASFSNSPASVPGDLVGAYIDGSDSLACPGGACPVNNPTTYYGALNDSYVDIFRTDGLGFHVGGFDASFIGAAPGNNYPAVAGLLRLLGFRSDGSSRAQDFLLAGPSADGFQFQHFTPTTSFQAEYFTEVVFYGFTCDPSGMCNAFSTNRGQFALDNLNFVPEPASLALLGAGMLGLFGLRRRQSARSE
jgi:hypothetical protein